MANLKLVGRIYDWRPWGFNGNFGGQNPDIGNSFWNALPQRKTAATLDSDNKPQLAPVGEGVGSKVVYATSDATFAEWCRDLPGKNAVIEDIEITLTDNGSGVWYHPWNPPYLPINGLGLGDEEPGHNGYFIFESNFQGFFYRPGQYINIACADDAFVYINGIRVPEISGRSADYSSEQVSLDTLGLTEGQYCSLRVYLRPGGYWPQFQFYTNIPLEEDYMVALSQWIIGSGTITPAAGAYTPGAQTITATPGAGYKLATLTFDGSPIVSGSSQTLTDHTTIAAVFTRDQKSIHICTRDEIIAAALRKCQVLAEGELPTNDQISTGAEALERFMHHSQSDCEFRWQFIQRTQAVASGEQTITLTGSEDVLDVYNAFLRDANGMDIPLRLVDAHWYDSTLAAKSTSDALPAVALASFNRNPDTNVASVTLSIYPKPAQAYTLYYRAMIKHYILENGTDEANFDEMWCEVVVYGLAARLADEYNRTERAVYLEQKFEKLKDAAKRKTGATRDSLTMFPV